MRFGKPHEQVIANGLYLGAQYALIALGLTLTSLMNALNFAHGQMYVLGGFITYEARGLLHLPFVVALLASARHSPCSARSSSASFGTVIRRSEREESTMLLAAGIAYSTRRSFSPARSSAASTKSSTGLHLGQSDPALGPHPRRGPRHSFHRRLHPDDAVHQAGRARWRRTRRGAVDGVLVASYGLIACPRPCWRGLSAASW